ncbi:hypothetical protein G6F40_015271 [Rhizopus arrhizus]|nr:hypothetical protein G6F40_015271 [Rhizopus arrhizus]KAG1244240.1 hypothetical protein G6F68_015524 [Rhizopus microsporus]KAG1257119.1 hypothetical protein G6F65_016034 [Rhizopus arrhizus]
MPASLCCDDGSSASALSSSRQRDALLEEASAKICIHQTRFHFPYRLAQGSVRQHGPAHAAVETSGAENAWHDHTVPPSGTA